MVYYNFWIKNEVKLSKSTELLSTTRTLKDTSFDYAEECLPLFGDYYWFINMYSGWVVEWLGIILNAK